MRGTKGYKYFLLDILGQRFNTNPIIKDMFKNLSWTIVGNVISKFALFISFVFVARLLGKEDYGRFGIIRSTLSMFGVFAGFGLGLTANKHIAEGKQQKRRNERILGLSIITGGFTGFILSIVLFIFSDKIAVNQLHDGSLGLGLKIASFIVLLSSLNMIQNGTLSGFFSFKEIARNNIMQSVIAIPVFIILTNIYGLNGSIMAFAIFYLIGFFVNQHTLSKKMLENEFKPNFKEALREISVLVMFSLPALLGGLLATPIRWYCESSLTGSPNGYSQLGIYNASLTVQSGLLLIATALNSPILSQINKERTTAVDFININLPSILFIILSLPFLYFSDLLPIIFGSSFNDNSFSLVLVLVLISTFFIIYTQGIFRSLASANFVWFGFGTNFVWAFGTIIFFLFIFKKDILGLLFSYNLAYILSTIFSGFVAYHKGIIRTKTFINELTIVFVIIFIIGIYIALNQLDLWLKMVFLGGSIIILIYESTRFSKKYLYRY